MTNRPRLQALLSDLQGQSRNDPHNDAVRRVLRLRAGNVCEYCLRRTTNPFHVDHIIGTCFQFFNFNGGGLDGPLVTRYEEIVTKRYPPAWSREWLM